MDAEMKSIASTQEETTALPSKQYCLFDRIVEHNLKYFNIVCKLGILPFEVDVEKRRISPTKSIIRWCWFYLISFLCFVKISYVDATLVATLLNSDLLQMLHLPIHLGHAIVSSAVVIYLFLRPKALCVGTGLLNDAVEKRDLVKSFSRQQLNLAFMPTVLTTITVAVSFGFPLMTRNVYQLGTLLRVVTEWDEENSKTISLTTYAILRIAAYILDAIPLLWTLMGAVYTAISHVIILEVLHSWCDELRVKPSRYNLAECFGELVDIQLIIGLFNHVYGDIIFWEKLFCFCTGISAFVMVFWYGFSENLIMAVVNLYDGVICLLLYPLIYERAAQISSIMENAKKSLLMATAQVENEQERAIWRRRVKSIRVMRIYCGPRPIERESLPLFYDFFWSNFISVLLTT